MEGLRKPAKKYALPRIQDRWSFVYAERCVVHRSNNSITFEDERGITHLPAATISALLLGPGTTISHQGINLLAECGTTVVWVGEAAVRYYAHGRSLATSTGLLERQAKVVSSQNERIRVARKMYSMRFAGEDVAGLTMQQLRGREGTRMKRLYREYSDRYGIEWTGRSFVPDDFAAGDTVNQALSSGNAVLYGIVHSVIVALGCSPGLGIIHTGHERAFVYDIADLYKAELVIPLAFQITAEGDSNVTSTMRHRIRNQVFSSGLIRRCVKDVIQLLADSSTELSEFDITVVSLWDYQKGYISGGHNYSDDEPENPSAQQVGSVW